MRAATVAATPVASLAGIGRRAVRDMAPVAVGVAPVGLLVGVAARGLELGLAATLLDTLLIFGGSAQLAASELLTVGTGAFTVLATVFVVQARLLAYSAMLEPMFRRQPRAFRWLGPTTVVDQTFALALERRMELTTPAAFRRYWLASSGLLAAVWLGAVAVGFVAGPLLPAASPLSIAVPALFVAMVAPRLRSRASLAAAVTAALVAAVGVDLPLGSGLLVGAGAGCAAGALVHRSTRPPVPDPAPEPVPEPPASDRLAPLPSRGTA